MDLFSVNGCKTLIGMIHLPASQGFEGFPGMEYCIKKSLHDLRMLEDAGFDAVLVENDCDEPSTEFANSAQIDTILRVSQEVAKNARIPFGVQVMLNDWKVSFDICKEVGASFTRLDVFVDNVTGKWGDIFPETEKIMAR